MSTQWSQALERLGFAKTEAEVYLALVRHGSLNGYQIAKIMNLSRSSVYVALNNLYRKNCIFLLPGEHNEYKAEDPQILLTRLKDDYAQTAENLAEALRDWQPAEPESRFFNIDGQPNILDKVRELLREAKVEVCLNTSLPLESWHDVLAARAARGVRCIVISAEPPAAVPPAIEFYPLSVTPCVGMDRLMLVVDDRIALIAGNRHGGKLIGTFTENPVLVEIVAEHINHDLYLSKLQHQLQRQVITDEVRTGTLSEQRFFAALASSRRQR